MYINKGAKLDGVTGDEMEDFETFFERRKDLKINSLWFEAPYLSSDGEILNMDLYALEKPSRELYPTLIAISRMEDRVSRNSFLAR